MKEFVEKSTEEQENVERAQVHTFLASHSPTFFTVHCQQKVRQAEAFIKGLCLKHRLTEAFIKGLCLKHRLT